MNFLLFLYADKARVELHRLLRANQSGELFNETIRHATATQEGFGDFATKAVKGVGVNARRAAMPYGVKPVNLAQVIFREDSATNLHTR